MKSPAIRIDHPGNSEQQQEKFLRVETASQLQPIAVAGYSSKLCGHRAKAPLLFASASLPPEPQSAGNHAGCLLLQLSGLG